MIWAAGRSSARTGSGYLLTPRLVLTARHVLNPLLEPAGATKVGAADDRLVLSGPRCTVRPLHLTESAIDYEAEMLWSLEHLDIALVRVVDSRWSCGALREGWWAPVTGTAEVAVTGLGFPRFQHDDTEQLVARVRPLSGLVRERLEIVVDDPPAAPADGSSPWAGISGAAVFAEDMLVGVIQSDPAATDHHRLRAVPASLFAEHPDFVRILTEDGGVSALRRSLLQRRQIDDLLELGVSDAGRLAVVAEVDLYELRITKTPYGERGYRHDPYVPRDRDEGLRAALERSDFVVLIGPSKAGKSRTAFEAALAVLPDAVLVVPRPGRRTLEKLAQGDLLDACCPEQRIVVWLDDLERFLAPSEGFDTGRLSQLGRRSPRLVVLATLRTDQLALLTQPGTAEIDKTVRQLLEAGEQVRLELSLSGGERERAVSAYPDEDFTGGVGIGERLVAGPLLRDKCLAALDDQPIRWCLALAAVDWRRIGMPRAVPEPTLRQLTSRYLADQAPNLDLTEDNYRDARTWALEPIAGGRGRIGLLSRDLDADPPGLDPLDYIIASVDGDDPRLETSVNRRAWEVGLQHASPAETDALAYTARARGVAEVAERAWQSLADGGDPEAASRLGALLMDGDRTHEAERWLRRAAATGNAGAMNNLGVMFEGRDRREDAERWYRSAASGGSIEAAANLAELLNRQGDSEEAEKFYRQAARGGHWFALGNLRAMLSWQGREAELEQEYREAASAGDRRAMSNLGIVLAGEGRAEEAEHWYCLAADAGDTGAMYRMGVMRQAQNRPDEAEHWYHRAADGGQIDAACRLGQMLAARGSTREAERWLRQAANLGDFDAMATLGALLQHDGHDDEAEKWYRRAAKTGHLGAMYNLALMLEAQGKTDEAEVWYHRTADGGSVDAYTRLGVLLASKGAIDEARRWLRSAADFDDIEAQVNLGLLLATALAPPDLAEARTWFTKAAEAGDAVAQYNLGVLLATRLEPPDLAEARTWLTRAAEAGMADARDALEQFRDG